MEDGFSQPTRRKSRTIATPVIVSHRPVPYKHPLRGEKRNLVKQALYRFLQDQAQPSGVLSFGQARGGTDKAVSEQFVFCELNGEGNEIGKFTFSFHQARHLMNELRREGLVKTYRKGEFYLSWVVEGCDQVAIDQLIANREAKMADPAKHSHRKVKSVETEVEASKQRHPAGKKRETNPAPTATPEKEQSETQPAQFDWVDVQVHDVQEGVRDLLAAYKVAIEENANLREENMSSREEIARLHAQLDTIRGTFTS
jgi:hypothetical protein